MALIKAQAFNPDITNWVSDYGASPWPEFEALRADIAAAEAHVRAHQFGIAQASLSDAGVALSALKTAIAEVEAEKESANDN